jgi:hypothetical protein
MKWDRFILGATRVQRQALVNTVILKMAVFWDETLCSLVDV